jgi:hypothetical protein
LCQRRTASTATTRAPCARTCGAHCWLLTREAPLHFPSEAHTIVIRLVSGRASRRLVELAAAQDREQGRKLAARLPLAPVETKPVSDQARAGNTAR